MSDAVHPGGIPDELNVGPAHPQEKPASVLRHNLDRRFWTDTRIRANTSGDVSMGSGSLAKRTNAMEEIDLVVFALNRLMPSSSGMPAGTALIVQKIKLGGRSCNTTSRCRKFIRRKTLARSADRSVGLDATITLLKP